MPYYDITCPNHHEVIDIMLKVGEHPPCATCGEPTVNLWRGKGACVIQDSIEGGVLIAHGLCNEDGTPKRYYSKSEIAAEAKRRGYVNQVTHTTAPGTDKNPHTTRWI